ncbi:ubiquitin-like protein [Roseibium aggregatum]|uniref:Ubiquitin-like domain-containing protein n=1 Tax=Roseibium aggregatum TaxID=187304 RepID=A0A926P1B7_9HYPH|nr:ubiquitin-like protein [Roseibium aggregatum]MBD1547550.1 hypothetical protein [Roseibium aggregatum]
MQAILTGVAGRVLKAIGWLGLCLFAGLMIVSQVQAAENLWREKKYGIVLEYGADWKPLALKDPFLLALEAKGVYDDDYPYHQRLLLRRLPGAPGKELGSDEIARFQANWKAAGGKVRKEGRANIGWAPAYYIDGYAMDGQQPVDVFHYYVKQDGFVSFFMATSPTDADFKTYMGHQGFGGLKSVIGSIRIKGYYPPQPADAAGWGMDGVYRLTPPAGWKVVSKDDSSISYGSDDWLSRVTIFTRKWDPDWDKFKDDPDNKSFANELPGTLGLYTFMPGTFDPKSGMVKQGDVTIGGTRFRAEWGVHRAGNQPLRRQIMHAQIADKLVVIRVQDRAPVGRAFPGRDLLGNLVWTAGAAAQTADGLPPFIPMKNWQEARQRSIGLSTRACKGDAGAYKELKRRAAVENGATDQVSLAWLLAWNKSCKFYTGDKVRNHELTRQAAKAGYPLAMSNYGLQLIRGIGTDKDPKTGVVYVLRAFEGGHPDAAAFLAQELISGEYLPQRLDRAKELIARAERAGAPAQLLDKTKKQYQAALTAKATPPQVNTEAWVDAGEEGKIHVRTMTGNEVSVAFSPNETVAGLKAKIADDLGVAAGSQRLFHNKKELADSNKLSSYGIKGGDRIFMMIKLN